MIHGVQEQTQLQHHMVSYNINSVKSLPVCGLLDRRHSNQVHVEGPLAGLVLFPFWWG